MDYQNFVGLPLDKVIDELKRLGVSYIIEENDSFKKQFDTVLVVNVIQFDKGNIKLVTDKFLLDI